MADFEKKFIAIETEYDSADVDRQSELELLYEETDKELLEAQRQFIRDYPESMRSLMLLYEIDWSL